MKRLLFSALASLLCVPASLFAQAPTPVKKVQFGRDVLPILSTHCLTCHGPDDKARKAGLRLDLAETALGWLPQAACPAAALRAVTSGYQALRRLSPEERDALYPALRYAAAREGARRLATGRPGALDGLRAVDSLGEPEARAAAG